MPRIALQGWEREYIYKALVDIPGISVVKPKAAFYIFPEIQIIHQQIPVDSHAPRLPLCQKIIEKLIETGTDNGEFYCEDCKGTARNIMFVLEGLKISAQTIGITAEAVDREILFILKSLGLEG